jgi:hypothetical protein
MADEETVFYQDIKKHTLKNIMFENIREFSKYIMGNSKQHEFAIPDIGIKRNGLKKERVLRFIETRIGVKFNGYDKKQF